MIRRKLHVKKLSTNRFAKAFLDDWNSFEYKITSRPESNNGKILFTWKFNKYSGYGDIDIKNGQLCNEWGDNLSNMTILEPNHIDFKTNDALTPTLQSYLKELLTNYNNVLC